MHKGNSNRGEVRLLKAACFISAVAFQCNHLFFVFIINSGFICQVQTKEVHAYTTKRSAMYTNFDEE